MKKEPVIVNIQETEEILSNYLSAGAKLNYAIKIVGHPGVGKSAIVKQVAAKKKFYFIDTRLAFKENIDLGGYPVPDHERKRMIYYRPKFIPPENVPENYDGIVWFLDESNRAHPTVVQTLFQIISERKCGDHNLPEKTSIILAGNLGEEDNTTITEFDDSALDGRLAIFHLKPTVDDWLMWASKSDIHPAVIKYISLFPDKLWDEKNINPNPRGWHQVSLTLTESYNIKTEDELSQYIIRNPSSPLVSIIYSLVCRTIGNDFINQFIAPRELTTDEVLKGDSKKLEKIIEGNIPSEDIFWAISGALSHLREINLIRKGNLSEDDLTLLGNVLQFIGYARSDFRMSFFYLIVKTCGLFTQIPKALKIIQSKEKQIELVKRFESILEC